MTAAGSPGVIWTRAKTTMPTTSMTGTSITNRRRMYAAIRAASLQPLAASVEPSPGLPPAPPPMLGEGSREELDASGSRLAAHGYSLIQKFQNLGPRSNCGSHPPSLSERNETVLASPTLIDGISV